MSDPVLAVEGLRRVYKTVNGPLEVLGGVDLTVAGGELVGLMGASGTGKSTLLQAAGLLDRPTSGVVRIDGRDCGAMDDAARTRLRSRAIGYVYQFHHLLDEFSALDNVALPALIAGVAPKKARERASQLLSQMGMSTRLSHQPGQLSGGERQRVAVARALINAPRLLLADEPTGNLDPDNAEALFGMLRELVRASGVAALVATHNVEMARHMDRMVVLLRNRPPMAVKL